MSSKIISSVLENYSLGELRLFLPSHSLKFIKNIFPERQIDKRDLVLLILSNSISDLLLDKKNRYKFISRMSLEDMSHILRKIVPGLDISITSNTYEVLKEYSTSNIEIFFSTLGLVFKDIESEKKETKPDLINVIPDYPLYPYQQKLVKKVIRDIEDNPENKVLLHLPTGAGKTRTAMNIVSQHLRNVDDSLVIWITASNELCEQAVEEFKKAWNVLGSHEVTCYKYFGKHSITLGGVNSGFLVASIQQLYNAMNKVNALQFELLSDSCTLLIFDEAHQCIAPTYKVTVDSIKEYSNKTYMIGLTATPGRGGFESDEEDKRLASYFNQNKLTMRQPGYESPVQFLIDEGYLAQPIFHKLEYTIPTIIRNEIDDLAEDDAIYQLSLIDDRNSAILQKVIEEYKNGSYIIIFACNVDHAINLSYALNYKGISSVSLTSKADKVPGVRREKINRYKSGAVRVIVNYGILTTGFDAPKTNVAIVARPTQSLVLYSQMIGRAMRGYKSGGNKQCNIYTVNDDIKQFTNANYAFINWNKNYV